MTLSQVIATVDEIKPNAFGDISKTMWMNEVEGLIQTEVMLLPAEGCIRYDANSDTDTELLVKAPHDKLYWVYLCAMIDFANGEYNKYQNTMQLFNTYFGEYMRWYAMRYHPADGRAEANGYYISAFSIAQNHGFDGTETEWLSSLQGEKGEPGEKGEKGEKGDRGLQGPKGEVGPTGIGITGISKTGTDGWIDTYTVTYSDGTSSSFTVTNGSGDMAQTDYDESLAVKNAGGIPAYVSAVTASHNSSLDAHSALLSSKADVGHSHIASEISAGTFGGNMKAATSGETTALLRNISLTSTEPTSVNGIGLGEIVAVYE